VLTITNMAMMRVFGTMFNKYRKSVLLETDTKTHH